MSAMSFPSKLPSSGTSIFTVMTKLANEHHAINLSQGFPDFDCAPELVEAVASYMRKGENQYAMTQGAATLREALADKVYRLYKRKYDPETEITVTAGATEGLFSAITALVHPGDEVILFEPAYDSYVPVVRLSGGNPVFVTLRFPDYRIDWDEVRRALSPKTRLLIINSPHNPTGTILQERDILELKRVLEKTSALVISDEVYEHVVFDGAEHLSLARDSILAERAGVISSFGKTYHTTGWKVGYCLAPKEVSAEIQRIHQFVTFSVNNAVQSAYADFVVRDPLASGVSAFYQQKRDLFLSVLQETRFRPLPCAGTYFQLLDYSSITNEPDTNVALQLLQEQGVASIPLSPFLYASAPDPVLRFCFAKRDDTLEQAAARLRRV